MNLEKLKAAEKQFLENYPGGFSHPEMQAIGKKHQMEKRVKDAQDAFARNQFKNPELIVENVAKTINRSSMVSMFEKPKFKELVAALTKEEKVLFSNYFKDLLHGNQEKGFSNLVSFLTKWKLAKWPLLTAVLTYYSPQKEVFVKPTTAKGIIEFFEIPDLKYNSKPSWDFYFKFRELINTMKTKVDPSLSPSSPAFTGFLMMTMGVN